VLGLWECDLKFNTALGTDYELAGYDFGTGDESAFVSIL
jgi:hypothetical protein